jgi:spoIIIJ-associated protein
MSAIEITAHDVETAIKTGLAQINLLRAEVKIEVLDEGSKGVLGIGARPARVRLTPFSELENASAAGEPATRAKAAMPDATPATEQTARQASTQPPPPTSAPQPGPAQQSTAQQPAQQPGPQRPQPSTPTAISDEPVEATEQAVETSEQVAPETSADELDGLSPEAEQLAATLTQGVLDRMSFQVTCTSRRVAARGQDDSPSIWVDIQGKDASRLLAHQSEALEALQLVVQTMWAHQTKSSMRLTLDADSYKERREKRIQQMAQRLAERVISTGRSITLEPMPPSERRLVHLALRDHPRVMTESHGEGTGRRVTIRLK